MSMVLAHKIVSRGREVMRRQTVAMEWMVKLLKHNRGPLSRATFESLGSEFV